MRAMALQTLCNRVLRSELRYVMSMHRDESTHFIQFDFMDYLLRESNRYKEMNTPKTLQMVQDDRLGIRQSFTLSENIHIYKSGKKGYIKKLLEDSFDYNNVTVRGGGTSWTFEIKERFKNVEKIDVETFIIRSGHSVSPYILLQHDVNRNLPHSILLR